jgi:hypothetical protein
VIRRCLVAAILLWAAPAVAQTADNRLPNRLEIDVGGGWLTGASLGEANAELLANERERTPFQLFAADGRFAGAPTLHARAGFAVNRRFAVEGGMAFSRPNVEVSTSADVEGGPSLTIAERIDQYVFDGSVLILIDEARIGTSTVPYAAVGGGYLRQLHEGLTLVEHGYLLHAGGGLKHWLRARRTGRLRAAGVRADLRVYALSSGVSLDDRPRPRIAISGSVFFGF